MELERRLAATCLGLGLQGDSRGLPTMEIVVFQRTIPARTAPGDREGGSSGLRLEATTKGARVAWGSVLHIGEGQGDAGGSPNQRGTRFGSVLRESLPNSGLSPSWSDRRVLGLISSPIWPSWHLLR